MSNRLAIFDMDGTLLLSPGPDGLAGAAKKAFWKDPEPLETRAAPVIAETLEALNGQAYSAHVMRACVGTSDT